MFIFGNGLKKEETIMKKIGIITLHGYFNYGNKLQNYASQEVLKSLGCDSISIRYKVHKKQSVKSSFWDRIKKANLNKIIKFFYYQLKKIVKLRKKLYLTNKEKKSILLTKKRLQRFKEFSKININESEYILSDIDILNYFHEQFDYLIVGSDQVWNPGSAVLPDIYFLTFAPQEKRIAYSASFGISELPKVCVEQYKDKLSKFEHVSVREDEGAKIIHDLIGREVKVVIDPTLMLDKDRWLKISTESKYKPNRPYILMYFLGDVSNEVIKLVNSLCREYDLESVFLENKNENIKDEERYTTDPGEFLDYVNSADLVLTDSFHGSVFSILFEKPFIVFDRKSKGASMISRIDTLLNKFELQDRKWENVKNTKNIFDVSFSHVPNILNYERTKAINYLKSSLNIKED